MQKIPVYEVDPTMVDSATNSLIGFPTPAPSSELALAAAAGDVEALRTATAEELQKTDESANTPLIWAADAGHAEAAAFLIDAGADINTRGYLGNTALNRACRGGHLETVLALLAAKANPDIPNGKMQYPLHFAAYKRHPKVVEAMLASGLCDLGVTDRKGRTAAEDTKDEKIRDMILAASASADKKQSL